MAHFFSIFHPVSIELNLFLNRRFSLSESSRLYFLSTCPSCVFRIGKACNRSNMACCIKIMEKSGEFIYVNNAF